MDFYYSITRAQQKCDEINQIAHDALASFQTSLNMYYRDLINAGEMEPVELPIMEVLRTKIEIPHRRADTSSIVHGYILCLNKDKVWQFGEGLGDIDASTDKDIIEFFEAYIEEAHLAQPDGQLRYVNAYSLEQSYGGPEEGGWYRTHKVVLGSIPVDNLIHQMNAMTDLKRLFSECCGNNIEISIEDRPAQNSVSPTHYE